MFGNNFFIVLVEEIDFKFVKRKELEFRVFFGKDDCFFLVCIKGGLDYLEVY